MHRSQVDSLDPRRPHWAAAVEAPSRDWIAVTLPSRFAPMRTSMRPPEVGLAVTISS